MITPDQPGSLAAPAADPGGVDSEFSLHRHMPALRAGFRGAILGSIVPIAMFYIVLTRVNLTAAVLVASGWTLTVFTLRWRRTRRFDMFSSITLTFLALQTTVGLVFQSTQAYLATPAVEGVVWCGIMLGSVVIRRPLIGIIARQFIPIPDELVGTRPYLLAFGLPTVLWGLVLLGRAAARLALLSAVPLEQFLVAITAISWISSLALLAFCFWYPNRVLRPYLRGERTVGSVPPPLADSPPSS